LFAAINRLIRCVKDSNFWYTQADSTTLLDRQMKIDRVKLIARSAEWKFFGLSFGELIV